MWQKMLAEQIQILENGGDPIAVIRDPDKARNIEVPVEWEGGTSGGRTDPSSITPLRSSASAQNGSRGPTAREADKTIDMWREYLTTQEEAAHATA